MQRFRHAIIAWLIALFVVAQAPGQWADMKEVRSAFTFERVAERVLPIIGQNDAAWDDFVLAYSDHLDRVEELLLGPRSKEMRPTIVETDDNWYPLRASGDTEVKAMRREHRRKRSMQEVDRIFIDRAVSVMQSHDVEAAHTFATWAEIQVIASKPTWSDEVRADQLAHGLLREDFSPTDEPLVRAAVNEIERVWLDAMKRSEASQARREIEKSELVDALGAESSGDDTESTWLQKWTEATQKIEHAACKTWEVANRRASTIVDALAPRLTIAGRRTLWASYLMWIGDWGGRDDTRWIPMRLALRRASPAVLEPARVAMEAWRADDDRIVADLVRVYRAQRAATLAWLFEPSVPRTPLESNDPVGHAQRIALQHELEALYERRSAAQAKITADIAAIFRSNNPTKSPVEDDDPFAEPSDASPENAEPPDPLTEDLDPQWASTWAGMPTSLGLPHYVHPPQGLLDNDWGSTTHLAGPMPQAEHVAALCERVGDEELCHVLANLLADFAIKREEKLAPLEEIFSERREALNTDGSSVAATLAAIEEILRTTRSLDAGFFESVAAMLPEKDRRLAALAQLRHELGAPEWHCDRFSRNNDLEAHWSLAPFPTNLAEAIAVASLSSDGRLVAEALVLEHGTPLRDANDALDRFGAEALLRTEALYALREQEGEAFQAQMEVAEASSSSTEDEDAEQELRLQLHERYQAFLEASAAEYDELQSSFAARYLTLTRQREATEAACLRELREALAPGDFDLLMTAFAWQHVHPNLFRAGAHLERILGAHRSRVVSWTDNLTEAAIARLDMIIDRTLRRHDAILDAIARLGLSVRSIGDPVAPPDFAFLDLQLEMLHRRRGEEIRMGILSIERFVAPEQRRRLPQSDW